MEADNVDYDTPRNKAIELSNFDGNDVLKSYYKYDKYVSTFHYIEFSSKNYKGQVL